MKPSAETGLASHSSNMVAPREFARGCEDGEGWIKVTSKKNLRKNKGIHKNKPTKDITFFSKENNQDEVSSASDASIKSDSSGTSWSSIVKKSLKMNVPRVSIDIASTSSTSKQSSDSNNEVQYLKTVRTCGVKVNKPSKVQVPPKIITVPDSDEASISESEFSEDECTPSKKVCASSTVQHKIPKNNEGSMFSGSNKTNQEKVNYLDNKRMHETAFSATSPMEINDIDKN